MLWETSGLNLNAWRVNPRKCYKSASVSFSSCIAYFFLFKESFEDWFEGFIEILLAGLTLMERALFYQYYFASFYTLGSLTLFAWASFNLMDNICGLIFSRSGSNVVAEQVFKSRLSKLMFRLWKEFFFGTWPESCPPRSFFFVFYLLLKGTPCIVLKCYATTGVYWIFYEIFLFGRFSSFLLVKIEGLLWLKSVLESMGILSLLVKGDVYLKAWLKLFCVR